MLDTNCLLACISSKSENFRVWKGFQKGSFTLCVSNEILEEYQEIITSKTNSIVAENIINAIIDFPQILVLKLHEFLKTLTEKELL